MLRKVISGAQTGADRAAIAAAKDFGVYTGGWIPAGCRCSDGPRPDLVETYHLAVHESTAYPPRTYANVRDSDGTLAFAVDFGSAGEICTGKAVMQYQRPSFQVGLVAGTDFLESAHEPDEIASWIRDSGVSILNVAGNSESTAPGIFEFVSAFMTKVFEELDKYGFIERMGR